VGRHAHRLLAARDYDLGIAVQDRLVAEGNRPQARAAQLVDRPCRDFDRNAGRDRGLPCRILPLAGSEDLAHDDLGDPGRLHARASECSLDGEAAQLVGRQIAECAIEGADRRAGRPNDDDVVFHDLFLLCSGNRASYRPHNG
jgi:hypothetical protein